MIENVLFLLKLRRALSFQKYRKKSHNVGKKQKGTLWFPIYFFEQAFFQFSTGLEHMHPCLRPQKIRVNPSAKWRLEVTLAYRLAYKMWIQ